MGRWIGDQNGRRALPRFFRIKFKLLSFRCVSTSNHCCVARGIAQNSGCEVSPPRRRHPWIKSSPIPAFPGHAWSQETSSAPAATPKISTSRERAGNLSLDKDPGKHRPLTAHLSVFDLQISGIFHPNQLSSHLPLRGQSSSCSIFCSKVFGVFSTL